MTLRTRIMGVMAILVLLGVAGYFAWQEYKPQEESTYPNFKKAEEDTPGFLRGRIETNLPKAPAGRE
jgi:hypothetical protein